jgi:hypothetical protein
VALLEARISVQPLWGFSSSNPDRSQSRAEQNVSVLLIENQAKIFYLLFVSRYSIVELFLYVNTTRSLFIHVME